MNPCIWPQNVTPTDTAILGQSWSDRSGDEEVILNFPELD